MPKTTMSRTVGAKAGFSAISGSVPASETAMAFDSVSIDDALGFTGVGTTGFKYVCKVPGEYLISGNTAANSSTLGTYVVRVRQGGTLIGQAVMAVQAATANGVAVLPSILVNLALNDEITITEQALTGTWARGGSGNASANMICISKNDN